MKKLLCAVLAMFMLAAMLFGTVSCGSGSDDNEDSEEIEERELVPNPFEDVTIGKQVLLSKPGVKVILNGIVTSGEWGVKLRLILMNNTDDTLVFQTDEPVINGFVMDSVMSVEVKPGKKAYASFAFPLSDLEIIDMTSISDIEFYLRVYEKDEWELKHETEKITLRTSLADTYGYVYDFWGETLYEDENLTVKAQGLTEGDDTFSAGVVICADNRSSGTVAMQVYDVTLNGDAIMPIFYNEVLPGKMAADEISILKSDFERLNVVDVVELSFSLHIFDPEGWEKSVDVKDITLQFEVRGDILYSENGVTVAAQGFEEDNEWGEGLMFLVRNASDKEYTIEASDIYVNGIKLDEEFSFDAAAMDSTRGTLVIPYPFLDENDIKEIAKVELTLKLVEASDGGDTVEIGRVTLEFE